MAIICPQCKFENAPGSLICGRCYSLLIQIDKEQPSTTIQPPLPPIESKTEASPATGEGTLITRIFTPAQQQLLTQRFSKFPPHLAANMLALYFDRVEEPLIIQVVQQAILGRYTDDKSQPRVDLSPYGAYERGVSRMHAVIRRTGTRLMIEDLDSSNGTFVNGVQIRPYMPRPLQSGDRIRLAQLDMAFILPSELSKGEDSNKAEKQG